ncbi:hypothetical protein ACCAA_50107 [Candidatus Accumulibacter aalborgensis]|uniref:Uncharacterized protein n=1 Tax=Candidatus Accumulibacter aalborgensis TaxID=1860102 RepID=A0A1A8XRY4_9PROT|nr:hypothetical protein ACCAA_50107 [Candidatus Accumulibacter aalborgensis]
MQPDGQTSTHNGESLWPSHSVHVLASILKKILPELIDLVGQTGLQSPQAVHMSESIFIAMVFLLGFSSLRRRRCAWLAVRSAGVAAWRSGRCNKFRHCRVSVRRPIFPGCRTRSTRWTLPDLASEGRTSAHR